MEWREVVNQLMLTPAEPDEVWTLDIDGEIAYANVNGKGHEDALVPLSITDEQWSEQIWYI